MAVALVEQQKDNLCGPYWAARILRRLGIESWDGAELDEDLVALRAGTLLPDPDDGSVPAGASSRSDYRFELPRAEPALSGTSAQALAEAIESAAQGAARCVPLRGDWTPERVTQLVEDGVDAHLLANVRTGGFWGTRPPSEALISELRGEQVEGPPPEWDVGHFCLLRLVVRGPGGALVLVHDSYPTLGWDGRHLQPPRAVAAALARGDGREGGVLAVVPGNVAGIEELAVSLGLEVAFWDNGTRR